MKTVLFIVALLALIGIGAAVLYKIGEVIAESQDMTRGREDGKAKENKNGDRH